MKSQSIRFNNRHDLQLAARLDLPVDRKPQACAIFAHCFTCSSDLRAVRDISLALTQRGVAVLRFDFTGLGRSEGEFAGTTFSSNVEDLIDAAAYMTSTMEAPQILIGHSLGGAAALLAGLKIDSIKAVATIGAPADPYHVTKLFKEEKEEILEKGEATVEIGGRPFRIRRHFIEELRELTSGYIRKLDRALLILHSPQDQIVGINNAREIYDAAMHPKSYISLDGADHLLSRKEDARYAGEMIASWAMRYIKRIPSRELRTEKEVVTRTGEEGFLTEIRIGRHSLLADEPESVGGTGLGPTPYGLLAASLGACTSMTLRMYADRKQWDLKEVSVHLSHSKDHADDCEHCEDAKSKIDVFERVIELEGDLDEKQRQRLLEIAERCPVHRTLHADINVRTSLRGGT